MTLPNDHHNFRVHAQLTAWKSEGEFPMRIGGIVTTDQLDKQGEEIVQTGLDFRPFLQSGWYNDNHGQRTSDVLGYPTDALYVRKGSMLPNGQIAENNGWWAEGYLLNTTEGRKVWDLCQAAGSLPGERRLGFSIEGKIGERDKRKPSRILTAMVRNVAVTHCPVNTGTGMEALVKALVAGSAIEASDASSVPGDGFPLRTESLDGVDRDEETEDEDDIAVKAEVDQDFLIKPMSEMDVLAGWIPALNVAHKRILPNERMTKAEARIIVRSQRPGLSEREIDEIVNRAAGGC